MKLSGYRVLLAEDNPTNQMVAIQMLEELGATVTLAEDGAKALELARAQHFDLMLIDIEMPRVSGLEVIRQIRAAPAPLGSVPLVALTAYVMREHREPILDAGANGIIAKPIVSIEHFGDDILHLTSAGAFRDRQRAEAVPERSNMDKPLIDPVIRDQLADSIGAEAMAELEKRVGEDLDSARGRTAGGLADGDVSEVRAATHIIMAVAGAIGAVSLQSASQKLNAVAHGAEAGTLAAEGAQVLDLLDRVIAHIRARGLR